eukprot:gene2854-3118_t
MLSISLLFLIFITHLVQLTAYNIVKCTKIEDERWCWLEREGLLLTNPVLFSTSSLKHFRPFFLLAKTLLCSLRHPCQLPHLLWLYEELDPLLKTNERVALSLGLRATIIAGHNVIMNNSYDNLLQEQEEEDSLRRDSSGLKPTLGVLISLQDVESSIAQWTLTLILTPSESCHRPGCLTDYRRQLVNHLLPSLREGLEEAQCYLLGVEVVFGLAGSGPQLEEELSSFCETIQEYLIHPLQVDPQASLPIRLKCEGLVVRSTGYYDAREELAWRSYIRSDSSPTDFYLLVDNDVIPIGGSWISEAIFLVARRSVLTEENDFGLSLQLCSWMHDDDDHLPKEDEKGVFIGDDGGGGEGDEGYFDVSRLLRYPRSPLLHRSHFDLLMRSSKDNDKLTTPLRLFLPDAHLSLNNFLLHDLYRGLNSLGCYHPEAVEVSSLEQYLLLHLTDRAEAYHEHLPKIRKIFQDHLNARYYSNNPITATAECGDKVQLGDALYEYYQAYSLDIDILLSDQQSDGEMERLSTQHCERERVVRTTEEVKHLLGLQDDYLATLPLPLLTFANQELAREAIVIYPLPLFSSSTPQATRVAVVTAIYGGYESSCKPIVRQSIAVDFYCFTDHPEELAHNAPGWILDSTPYHLLLLTHFLGRDEEEMVNRYDRNNHPFNIAKFYKLSFRRIPHLQDYDVVIWMDGTLQLRNMRTAEIVQRMLLDSEVRVITWKHMSNSNLSEEVAASIMSGKYTVTHWAGHAQPYQNVEAQLDHYIRELHYPDPYGRLACTCFVAVDMRSEQALSAMENWMNHVLTWTTQDQVSFPVAMYQSGINPLLLPNKEVLGSYDYNDFFVKLPHGM